MNGDTSTPKQKKQSGGFVVFLILLAGALAFLCRQGFLPHQILFANDMPLGAMLDSSDRLPGTFTGHWGNLYWLGGFLPSSAPAFSTFLQMIFQPQIYMKIYAPLTMFILGAGAWFFFRQLGFAPAVCVIGGLAAGLNMHYFSNACWGLGQWSIAAGLAFTSIAIVISPHVRPFWGKGALAGLAAGLMVVEGFDAGAILSLYVGIFIVFHLLADAPDPARGIPRTIGMGTLVMFFAILIASSTLYTLVGTQIQGTANLGQSPEERKANWQFNTQWSFPKIETLRLAIPGLFGYRLQEFITDTNKASAYWGKIAEDPHIDEMEHGAPEVRAQSAASLGLTPDIQNAMASDNMAARTEIMDQVKAQLQRRHTGSGDYTGVLVCLLACFGLFNSWRKLDCPYSKIERQAVWFWGVAALFSLAAAWGRYGLVYRFIYHLPFLNNIRNPIKYLHPLNICLIILAGYGLEALHRRYTRGASNRSGKPPQPDAGWWQRMGGFGQKWALGMFCALGVSVIGLLFLSSSKSDLVRHLEHNGFSAELAPQMAGFCIREVVLFIVFFAASAAIVVGILSGAWSKSHAAWVLLGAIMIIDIGRADLPWVRYFDYQEKYSLNPVVEFLRHEPWEHRVVSRLSPTGPYDMAGNGNLAGICHFWLENDYLANNIQSLELDQAPRMPDLDHDYIGNFSAHATNDLSPPVRLWRLTNTRYLLVDAGMTAALNQLAEPRNSFRNVMRMDIVTKPGVPRVQDAGDLTVQTNDTGPVALVEFTRALPRAGLYANWQMLGDQPTLNKLNSAEFDPAKTVLIATNTPVAQAPTQPDADPGTVSITSYKPKDIKLDADAKTPAVLMLNDRIGEYWRVFVDEKPASVLRCNYIMRGVFLPPGRHAVEFRFRAPLQWLYVSVSACAMGVLLAGYVIVSRLKKS